jgi:hypothetical protein
LSFLASAASASAFSLAMKASLLACSRAACSVSSVARFADRWACLASEAFSSASSLARYAFFLSSSLVRLSASSLRSFSFRLASFSDSFSRSG